MTKYEALDTLHYRSVKDAIIDHIEDQLNTDSYTRNETIARINAMSKWEIFNAYLEEEGIIGYTDKIVDLFITLDNIDNTKKRFRYEDTDSVYKATIKEIEQ